MPQPPAPSASASGVTPPPLAGRVLYIEDEPVCVALVRGMLAAFPQVELLHAATGLEGVTLARAERPALVLLDMNLPDIGGVEVVRRLNDDIVERGLRVAILTGDQLNIDIIKAMSLGAFEYWVKPLARQPFEAGLRRALSGTRPDPARTLASYR